MEGDMRDREKRIMGGEMGRRGEEGGRERGREGREGERGRARERETDC